VESKWERIRINKYAQAIRKGWMKTMAEKEEAERQRKEEQMWDIWQDDSVVAWRPKRMPKAIPAPKRELPAHAESYNPPSEYLFDEKEKQEWEQTPEEDRPLNYLPKKFDALRKVPLFQDLVREHFERCLDLYICPRVLRKKVNIQDEQQLIPEMPSPNDLKPFPTRLSIEYNFHTACVRSMAVSHCGNFLASGDVEGNLAIWQVSTTRILHKYKLQNAVIDCVSWNPHYPILAVANEEKVCLFFPQIGPLPLRRDALNLFTEAKKAGNEKWSFSN